MEILFLLMLLAAFITFMVVVMTKQRRTQRFAAGLSQMILSIFIFPVLSSIFSSLDGAVASLFFCLFLFGGSIYVLVMGFFTTASPDSAKEAAPVKIP
ncbi:hypothetical protein GRF59_22660 [Paenibacillus sp. HJL G12]|uniref:Uncharacterized protein n=1 Tax=Paenibacillus dendrobii TaxID=2691084 RepID=A0A7X3IPC2_9BACL|nr:hypothetical protein [Paenibacillus dendrobii]MWV46410.1 hypothetical protein [Paenibacillus dendrobii]